MERISAESLRTIASDRLELYGDEFLKKILERAALTIEVQEQAIQKGDKKITDLLIKANARG